MSRVNSFICGIQTRNWKDITKMKHPIKLYFSDRPKMVWCPQIAVKPTNVTASCAFYFLFLFLGNFSIFLLFMWTGRLINVCASSTFIEIIAWKVVERRWYIDVLLFTFGMYQVLIWPLHFAGIFDGLCHVMSCHPITSLPFHASHNARGFRKRHVEKEGEGEGGRDRLSDSCKAMRYCESLKRISILFLEVG